MDSLKFQVGDVSIEIAIRSDLAIWGQVPPYDLTVFKKARKWSSMSEKALGSRRLTNASGKALIEVLKTAE